jgi:enoyl-CoA hydratase/carnithine racemase
VLIFRGSGSRTFSSGYTIEAIRSRLEERTFEKFLNRWRTSPAPRSR